MSFSRQETVTTVDGQKVVSITGITRNLDNAQRILSDLRGSIGRDDLATANQKIEQAKALLEGGTDADRRQQKNLADLQETLKKLSNNEQTNVNEMLAELNKNIKDITTRKEGLESVDNKNANLVSSLAERLRTVANGGLGVNSNKSRPSLKDGRLIASTGVSDVGFTGQNGYKPDDLKKLQNQEEILSSFEGNGYNWKEYAGDNFYGLFKDSMDIHASLNKSKSRKQIGQGDNDIYVRTMDKAGQATAGDGWRENYANAALTVTNVIERSAEQWVKYGYSNNEAFSPATVWDCSRSGEFLTNFSVNAELQQEDARRFLGKEESAFQATAAQDAYGLKLNPLQLVTNYPQITDPTQIQPGDTLYVKINGDDGITQHTVDVIGNDQEKEELMTYDTKWGLSIVCYDQITQRSVETYNNYYTPKSNKMADAQFVATDMSRYAEEQETITRWCADEAARTGRAVEKMWDITTKAMKNMLKTEKGPSIANCRKVIDAMADESATVEIHGKALGENGFTKFQIK